MNISETRRFLLMFLGDIEKVFYFACS